MPWGRNAVDLFFSYDPFHDAMEAALRRVPFGDTTIPILAPDAIAYLKDMETRFAGQPLGQRAARERSRIEHMGSVKPPKETHRIPENQP